MCTRTRVYAHNVIYIQKHLRTPARTHTYAYVCTHENVRVYARVLHMYIGI